MKGWVFISPEGLEKVKDMEYWVNLALNFNDKAKVSSKNNVRK